MSCSPRRMLLLALIALSAIDCRTISTEAVRDSSSAILQSRATPPSIDSQDTSKTKPHWLKYLPRMHGVNMAGLEFGIGTNGDTNGAPSIPPPLDQITHFAKKGMNTVRFPMGWQYVQKQVKGELDPTQLGLIDKYVTASLQQKIRPILDLHAYDRRDGKIIGQSDLGADALVDFWTKMAAHHKHQPHVIFGIMNEPHDGDSKTWIGVVQAVVTGIRSTGARNTIIIPGMNWSHLSTFADDYHNGMAAIKNPDGTSHGLVFEIHQYFDGNGSGTDKECSQDHVDELKTVAALLKKDGRQALVTEMGGGATQSCTQIITKFVKAVDDNYPAIAGALLWGAGSFDQNYPLVLTVKNLKDDTWVDQSNLNALTTLVAQSTKQNTNPTP